ncbi:hypothetical protein TrST_g5781 [Triparma strigata]|uniref:Uncharacterized protein n=1 Tax=Triparma strigata TaxID=1606541 RepID=A0A9W7BV19_9STRA|nr:hypothetical protein TrST_g5781 [Triparma strigata]
MGGLLRESLGELIFGLINILTEISYTERDMNTSSGVKHSNASTTREEIDTGGVDHGESQDEAGWKTPAAEPAAAKWVVPSFFHTKQFMRHFLDIIPINMLMTMRPLGSEWLEVVDAFIDGKVESGVMTIVGGNDLSFDGAVAQRERNALVTQVVFLLNITKVGDGDCMIAPFLAIVEIPEGVESIGKFAFGFCRSLTTVSFPTTLTSIGVSAFRNCRVLDNVDLLHTQLQKLGHMAFNQCSELKSMTIPDSLQTLGQKVFHNFSKLVPSAINVNYDSDEEDEEVLPDATSKVIAHLRSLQM